jgi:hypothetical protein
MAQHDFIIHKENNESDFASVRFNLSGTDNRYLGADSNGDFIIMPTPPNNKISVSENDINSDFLTDKFTAGDYLTKSIVNSGGKEFFRLDVNMPEIPEPDDKKVLTSINDGDADYIYNKLEAGDNIAISEQIDGTASPPYYKIQISANNTDNFKDLTDTPSSYSGNANKFVSVNSSANGLEFVDVQTNPYPKINRLDTGSNLPIPNGDVNIESQYVNLGLAQVLPDAGGYKLYYKIIITGSAAGTPQLYFYLNNVTGNFNVGKLLTLKQSAPSSYYYKNQTLYENNYDFNSKLPIFLSENIILEFEYYIETASSCTIDLKLLATSSGKQILDYSYSELTKDS